MNIAFFISDHGYGHVMRNIPIMEELASRGHTITVVSGNKQCKIVSEYLSNVKLIDFHTDVGLVLKPNTLLVDKDKTSKVVYEYIDNWEQCVEFGIRVIEKNIISIAVVDIAPWALISAKKANIPSFLISSFTWVEQYKDYLDIKYVRKLRDAFKLATHNIFLPLINNPTKELLNEGIAVGFISRRFDESFIKRIQELHQRPIVFLMLGGSNYGLDFEIDVSSLPYDFITYPTIKLKGDNVTVLSTSDNNSYNYVRAAHICISKAGWSSVSEMIVAGAKFALLRRNDVPEDTMIINQLEKEHRIIAVDVEELKSIGNIIQRIEKEKLVIKQSNDDSKNIADIIERSANNETRNSKRIQ